MSNTIPNGSNKPLNFDTGTVPDVGGAMLNWFQPCTFELIEKQPVNFEVVEYGTPIIFQGVVQPFSLRQLALKPQGQRAWTWLMVHADPVLDLKVDDIIRFLGKNFRVMQKKNYTIYNYIEYHLVQDWTGSDPIIVLPNDIDNGRADTNVFTYNVDNGFASTTDFPADIDGGQA